ncbi:MAG: hypothetical protein U0V87_07760 [Acidobacteriota bacterium]
MSLATHSAIAELTLAGGMHRVVLTVSDGDRSSTASFNVTVRDTQPPVGEVIAP